MTTVIEIPTVETARLRLRAAHWRDFEAYAAFAASARTRFTGGPFDRDAAFRNFCALVGHWQARGFGRWMIADRETDAALGVVGNFQPESWPAPELAWTVFEHAEGRGVAREAAEAARRWSYDTLGWKTLISHIDADNARSIALAERLGAAPDGVFESSFGPLVIYRHPGPEACSA